MRISYFIKATIFSLVVFLAACGGDKPTDSDGNINTSTGTNTSSVNTNTPSKIGFGSGNAFVSGTIGVGVGNNQLSAGGITTLTVNIVNSSNALVTTSSQVTFNSPCYASGESIFKVGTAETNKITTDTGEATITYQANGCQGGDNITATVSIGSGSGSATATLTIAQDVVSSITPVSITPTQIGIKGTGGQETSAVKFQVVGSTGAPIKNVTVDFTLSSTVGGLALASSSGVTDTKGEVIAIVQSGAKSANVSVTATARVAQISTQATGLIVSTGVPDQDSMSLAVETKNPAAWEYDGVEVDFTVRLADAANNKVPDGTPVYFTTNGGAIPASCTTDDGGCTVKWVSQQPRPANGQVTVLVTAQGNESFIDVDGSGYYENGVDTFNTSNCSANVPSCDDLGEAYLDINHDGSRNTNEVFEDYNGNKQYDVANGIYNGVLCKTTTDGTGCTKTGITIRNEAKLVMSSQHPQLESGRLPGQPPTISLGTGIGITEQFDIILADINLNAMPVGTTLSANTGDLENATVTISPSTALESRLDSKGYTVKVRASSNTLAPSGGFSININVPTQNGNFTTTTFETDVN